MQQSIEKDDVHERQNGEPYAADGIEDEGNVFLVYDNPPGHPRQKQDAEYDERC